MEKTRRLNLTIAFLILLMLFFSLVSNIPQKVTYAEETQYSNVLTDLQKDKSFNIEDYPIVENDTSLTVLQIAEGVNGELFVYVYQPSATRFLATELRFSTEINNNATFFDYKLKFLNFENTLYKYKVEGFKLRTEETRYYNVICIFRKWNADLGDTQPSGDNTIDYVSYKVEKLWTVNIVDGQLIYSCIKANVIEITEKYVGSYRYANGIEWFSDSCDSHYVAFSTDKEINRLLQADVSYVETPICKYYSLTGWHYVKNGYYNVPVSKQVSLIDTDKASNTPFWLGGKSYSWKRIQSVNDFLNDKNVKVTEETKEQLKNKKWILRFAETTYFVESVGVGYHYETNVNEVSVLRLKFEENDIVYNLGVVDNKQSSDNIPDNATEQSLNWLLIIVCLIFLFIVLFVPDFFVLLGKSIWWIISLPFEIFKD